MNFQGELTDNMRGFYRSSYKDLHDKEKVHWIASTQFEATGFFLFVCLLFFLFAFFFLFLVTFFLIF